MTTAMRDFNDAGVTFLKSNDICYQTPKLKTDKIQIS